VATVPAVIVALLQGSATLPVSNFTFALIVIGFYVLVQMFENNVIVPKVLGEAVNLHPLLVMTGVLVGASVAGILGALLAAPVLATIKEVASYAFNKMIGQPPFPEPALPAASSQPPLIDRVKDGAARLWAWWQKLVGRWGRKT
jgi:predicted PurR-regulated permease PerM